MKKSHIFGVMLFAVLAFCAVSAASAFAAEAEWLVNGKTVSAEKAEGLEALATSSELQLTDLTALGNGTVDCSGTLKGTIINSKDILITEVLNLAGTVIPLVALEGTGLNCEGLELCTGLAEAWADNLPWLVEPELQANGTFLFNLTEDEGHGPPGYHIVCKNILGGTTEDLCTRTLSTGLLENMTTEGLLAIFSLTELETNKEEATCTLTKEETGHVNGSGTITVDGGAAITVSE